ncbi:hypothetical protein WR25_08235 [Diploscapter pachys]|uniref:Monocyte to macrophage differentiation factor 2 n=1 Tax=Diploscapter pachys TaxID=2018661 RepID=A0A2A2LHP1_9BILA|nr:hypothetical protein WR25_08235 [Diploscapter pachys]
MSYCGFISPPYKNKRAGKGEAYEPTHIEHWANTLSHAIGIVPSIITFYYITQYTGNNIFQYRLMITYGIFTTLLFLSSTLYHSCELCYREEKKKSLLRYYLHIGDRAAIYLFIAASYTPWLTLRSSAYPVMNINWWFVWAFAIIGIVYQMNFHERYKTLETTIYIFQAALPGVALMTMEDQTGVDLMKLGGFVYACGVVFFKCFRPYLRSILQPNILWIKHSKSHRTKF